MNATRSTRSRAKREALSRARILSAAIAIADAEGLEGLTMRRVGDALGVEAMSLYRHVNDKNALLDGLMEFVFTEIALPALTANWRVGMRQRATSTRDVLLRHHWAAMLIESRTHPSPARLQLYEASLEVLRRCGFSIPLAYNAQLTLDSYVYGFVLQEIWWPFEPEERPDVIAELQPHIPADQFPRLAEMMEFASSRGTERGGSHREGYKTDFLFGLELVLDGLERALEGERPQGSDASEREVRRD